MRQWIGSALIQIMACRLSVPKHYLNQSWVIVSWTLRNKFQWNFNQNTKLFIHDNAYQNIVSEMVAIFPGGGGGGGGGGVGLTLQILLFTQESVQMSALLSLTEQYTSSMSTVHTDSEWLCLTFSYHYSDVIMGAMASHHCWLKRSFSRRSKKTSKLRVTALCGDRWISRTKSQWRGKCSIWWRHHEFFPVGVNWQRRANLSVICHREHCWLCSKCIPAISNSRSMSCMQELRLQRHLQFKRMT